MRTATLILSFLLVIVPAVNSQSKRTTPAPKPKVDSDLFDPIPKDETLYGKADYDALKYRTGWRLVGFSNEDSEERQTKTYYDPRRVIVVGPTTKRAWVKFDTTKGATLEKSFTSFVEYDCAGARTRTLAATVFDKEGRPVGNADAATPSAWKYVVPDTLAEGVYGVICLKWKDKVEQDMDQAARWFMLGRQAEKRREFKGAELLYERAKDFDAVNDKILAAIERVKKP